MKKQTQLRLFMFEYGTYEQPTLDKAYEWVLENPGHVLSDAWGAVPSMLYEFDRDMQTNHCENTLGCSFHESIHKSIYDEQHRSYQRCVNEMRVIAAIRDAAYIYRDTVVAAILREIRRGRK